MSFDQLINTSIERYNDNKLKSIPYLKEILKYEPHSSKAKLLLTLASYESYGIDSALYWHDMKFPGNRISSSQFDEQIQYNFPISEVVANYRLYGSFISNEQKTELLNEKKMPAIHSFPAYNQADSLQGGLRPERTCFDVKHYDLDIELAKGKNSIKGKNIISLEVIENTSRIQLDLFAYLSIDEIALQGIPLQYKRVKNAVFIDFTKPLLKGEKHKITIKYHGKVPKAIMPPWKGGFVIKKDHEGYAWQGVTCEHLGASSWWPNKDYLADKPDSMTIQITVPKKLVAVANGDLVNEITIDSKKKYTWKVEYPINNYNVTFYVGRFKHFSDFLEGNPSKRLDYYVLPYHEKMAQKHFKQTQEILKFYEETFGEYPFWRDGFALVESPYEGMEHQSAIAYGSGFVSNENQDRYKNKFFIYDYIIVHEAAHEWWGNVITVDDMADVWLHEGFATYAEMLFMERTLGYDAYQDELANKRKEINHLLPIVGYRGVNDNAFAGWDIYDKGANVLHNLRCIVNNDSLFIGLLQSFIKTYQQKPVNTTIFITFVSQYLKKGMNPFFTTMLYQASLPVLKYETIKKGTKKGIRYRWENVTAGFEMPFGVVIDGSFGERIVASSNWQERYFENANSFFIPQGWHPDHKMLPANSFTMFSFQQPLSIK